MTKDSIQESRNKIASFIRAIRMFPPTPQGVDEDIALLTFMQGLETGRNIERLREATDARPTA